MHNNRYSSQHGNTSHYRVNYRAKTIGYDCFPIVRLSPDAIVRWDYRPNPIMRPSLYGAVLRNAAVHPSVCLSVCLSI